MPECRVKVSPFSAISPVFNRVRPASVFRHQGHSDTTGHGLVCLSQSKLISSFTFSAFQMLMKKKQLTDVRDVKKT
jgi:hypothetical protein